MASLQQLRELNRLRLLDVLRREGPLGGRARTPVLPPLCQPIVNQKRGSKGPAAQDGMLASTGC
jgi:hypothetical protein